MCGIVGIVSQKKITEAYLHQALQNLGHRGPDGSGVWVNDQNQVILGHTRLSIIDLEGGKQPMHSSDGNLSITFNGEIYNYLSLKNELKALNYQFFTSSDTEVIIYAYQQWGKDCVKKLRGMFAFAISDKQKQEVFIARDQFGIKPLVYYKDNNQFIFASEIQAIKGFKGLDLKMNLTAIDQFLWLQYIPAPTSIYDNIKKLPPAHYLTVNFQGEIKEIKQYWQLKFQPDYSKSEAQWIEETESMIKDSVKAHLVSDVPFGGFLSGGIDSSLVVTYMSQLMNRPVKTFSIGFENNQYNELPYAQVVADYCKTEHHVEIVRPDALSILPDLVRHFGEPFGDSSAIPTYYVSKMARKNVTMVLSGDGGDEFFAGYERHLSWMRFLNPASPTDYLKRKLFPLAHKLSPNNYPDRRYGQGASLHNLTQFIQYIPLSIRKKLWKGSFHKHLNQMPSLYQSTYDLGKNYDQVNTTQNFDIHTYLPQDILTKVDITGMMNSLESRTPLVDIRMAEFAATIPSEFNLRKINGKWEGKILLKKVLEKNYPKDFVYRKKRGFSIPLEFWIGNNEKVRKEITERITGTNSTLNHFFDLNTRKEIIKNGQVSWVWVLLFLEEWLRQNT